MRTDTVEQRARTPKQDVHNYDDANLMTMAARKFDDYVFLILKCF